MRISRPLAATIAAVAIVIALLSVFTASDSIRMVDAIGLFAGGFGAGAGLVAALKSPRKERSG